MDADLLRSVSRSFYLSIRFLPAQLREPIGVAYLLARTTDTVADTAQISGNVRLETLKLLSNGIQGTASRDVVAELIASFVSLQKNASERQLLESLPDCIACLEGCPRGIRLVPRKQLRTVPIGLWITGSHCCLFVSDLYHLVNHTLWCTSERSD